MTSRQILSLQDIKKIADYTDERTTLGDSTSALPVHIGISISTLRKICFAKEPVSLYAPTFNKIRFYFKNKGIILGEQ